MHSATPDQPSEAKAPPNELSWEESAMNSIRCYGPTEGKKGTLRLG